MVRSIPSTGSWLGLGCRSSGGPSFGFSSSSWGCHGERLGDPGAKKERLLLNFPTTARAVPLDSVLRVDFDDAWERLPAASFSMTSPLLLPKQRVTNDIDSLCAAHYTMALVLLAM